MTAASKHMNQLGIYIHIPFCVKKCIYCDFLSFPADDAAKSAYMAALNEEIKATAEDYAEYQVQTIFFGGGTPSCIAKELIKDCLSTIQTHFHIADNAEISLELNPKTASPEKLEYLRAAGINRLSIGLQSANDNELKLLGRIHTFKDFLTTYMWARNAGFSNINIDLISALPGQSLKTWQNTLHAVCMLEPEHISAYSLIVEEGTKLFDCISQYPPLPDEETDRLMYYETKRLLSEYGYVRYEISNYAKKGFESRHNQIYWQRGCDHIRDYIGLGLGAASTVGSRRYRNTDNLSEYMEDCKTPDKLRRDQEQLSRQELIAEFLFLGLRRMQGISMAEFERTFAVRLDSIYPKVLKKWKDAGYLDEKDGFWFLTEQGIDISNVILSDFVEIPNL